MLAGAPALSALKVPGHSTANLEPTAAGTITHPLRKAPAFQAPFFDCVPAGFPGGGGTASGLRRALADRIFDLIDTTINRSINSTIVEILSFYRHHAANYRQFVLSMSLFCI